MQSMRRLLGRAVLAFSLWSQIILSIKKDYNLRDFSEMCLRQKHFVLDTWLVKHAWVNPSMIFDPDCESRDKVVMVWRVPDSKKFDKIGYFWINSTNWESIRTKDWIERFNVAEKWKTYLIGEDSRVFNHNGNLWLVYNTHLTKFKQLYYAQVYFNKTENSFFVHDPPLHVTYEKELNVRHQKNWTPFDYCPQCRFDRGYVDTSKKNPFAANLLFSYSLQPHRIVETYPSSQPGEMDASTVFLTEMLPEYVWNWGEMRGGSPSLMIGDSYLSFFHSSGRLTHKRIITYVMGAYMFDSKPPFAITHISPEPIMHEVFINESYGWAYRAVDYITFPMGFVIIEPFIYLSYGKNDRDGWILRLNKTGLIDSLKPVKTITLGVSDFDKDSGKIVRGSYRQLLNGSHFEGVGSGSNKGKRQH